MLRLELVGITKTYPLVKANDSIDLRVEPGSIHAVLGENGAGKSTLMKIIYGVVQPDAGEIRYDGRPVRIHDPREAQKLGIAMVFQHFSLFASLTAAENVWLGLDDSPSLVHVKERMLAVASEYGFPIEPDRPVDTLSIGERQRVEITRALLTNPKLLILDEPTSVLTPQAAEKLFGTLQKLRDRGCSILYISHKLDEIRELCDRCTVLCGGRVTGEVDPSRETRISLSRLMLGAEPPEIGSHERRRGAVMLRVNKLCLAPEDEFGTALSNVELEVCAGEIVGVAGVSGNGQKELAAVLSGEDARATGGMVEFEGKDISHASPEARRRLGVHFIPEERLGRGAVPELSLPENTLLTRNGSVGRGGFLSRVAMQRLAQHLVQRFRVKTARVEARAGSLSGGNLQKFLVGREIDARPRLLIAAQPTWGVDVGSAAQIQRELLELSAAGSAVLLISDDLDELFALSDQLVVMAKGRMSPRVATRDASVEQIGEWMSGLFDDGRTNGAKASTGDDGAGGPGKNAEAAGV
jgi:ABC-type uncharacterized transport system ATPase subunit